MNLDVKLRLLNEMYKIHSRWIGPLTVSCRRYCSTCCTQNVTMTTLEGVFILNEAMPKNEKHLLNELEAKQNGNRLCPETTLNHLAELCAQGKEIPEEKDFFPEGKCLLLENDLCSIYPARPFGCRCFLSKCDCRETGFADMYPFVLTVNTLFLQFIEHIDAGGLSGNLVDVLLFLKSHEKVKAYENAGVSASEAGLIQNRPISVLFIPPEHKNNVADLVFELQHLVNKNP
jgi:hypothetical protein